MQEFTPEESEDRLYNLVSEYLRRENLQALPSSQRSLMTLVLRKLLASSSFAIAGALETISRRLQARLKRQEMAESLEEELDKDYEVLDETAEEWPEDPADAEPHPAADRAALEREIADLEQFRSLAVSITHNAKGAALLIALDRAFAEAERLGAPRKANIFTESRRTQDYLLRLLADSPHADGIVLFDGSNNDVRSRQELRNGQPHARLQEVVTGRQEAIRRRISERNAAFFEEEAAKLDSWADDLKVALEREIKELDRQIKEARRAASATLTLEVKLEGQKQVRTLEGQRNSKRRALFDAQDEIDHRREQLIAAIEGKLKQGITLTNLFQVRWRLI